MTWIPSRQLNATKALGQKRAKSCCFIFFGESQSQSHFNHTKIHSQWLTPSAKVSPFARKMIGAQEKGMFVRCSIMESIYNYLIVPEQNIWIAKLNRKSRESKLLLLVFVIAQYCSSSSFGTIISKNDHTSNNQQMINHSIGSRTQETTAGINCRPDIKNDWSIVHWVSPSFTHLQ